MSKKREDGVLYCVELRVKKAGKRGRWLVEIVDDVCFFRGVADLQAQQLARNDESVDVRVAVYKRVEP